MGKMAVLSIWVHKKILISFSPKSPTHPPLIHKLNNFPYPPAIPQPMSSSTAVSQFFCVRGRKGIPNLAT